MSKFLKARESLLLYITSNELGYSQGCPNGRFSSNRTKIVNSKFFSICQNLTFRPQVSFFFPPCLSFLGQISRSPKPKITPLKREFLWLYNDRNSFWGSVMVASKKKSPTFSHKFAFRKAQCARPCAKPRHKFQKHKNQATRVSTELVRIFQ